ncbi:nucleotidyl transferase AbiEii/AbiGii toxin family protein [Adlercreutzia sp. R7]|uniref:Nucleotidyl transferase AbiEii/AbiGii toxin family protein n=1 Tax=Adlercreutzia wanghongyangiae TaxID=3111451 RepID=A0ABU6IKA0_9ACTN|nr:nucleotidyl transferase AbiEii/AbiGii toxin family protein [Adlercreutzia sp. R7]
MSDFLEFSRKVAVRNKVEDLLPVVEKELIHYDILRALAQSDWLCKLNFQGGTCLRLCYGGVRYSEDLDFNTRLDLTATDLSGFKDVIGRNLTKRFGVDVRVKEPKKVKQFDGGGTMKRWQVVVDTAPERPDLPSQKIKIEIAQVPSYTRENRVVVENYSEIQGVYGSLLVGCQSLNEILADKLVSFAQQVKAPRYRDLWDIPWIMQRPGVEIALAADLVLKKVGDYATGRAPAELLADGAERAAEYAVSEAYIAQMRRFLPSSVMADTIERPLQREALKNLIVEGYQQTIALIS